MTDEELKRFAEWGKTLTPKSALQAENRMLRAKLDVLRAAAERVRPYLPHDEWRDLSVTIEASR